MFFTDGKIKFNIIKTVMGIVLMTCIFITSNIVPARRVLAYDEIVVVIDPGHGGTSEEGKEASNLGATYHDLYEKDVNLITAKALRDELETYENVTVYLTREDDRELTLDARVDYAESVGADFLISIHYNASEDHNFFGSEIFVSAFGECYSKGYDMADNIMTRWLDYGNIRKDIKTRVGESGKDYYGLIRIGEAKNIPTIILEHGYLDNDNDYLRIKDEKAWKELGKCDALGISDYYGLSKNVIKDTITPAHVTKTPDAPVLPDTTGPEDVKLTIDAYDSKSGKMDFTISAKDGESRLMYYGFVKEEATEETVFPELFQWKGDNGEVKGSINVGKDYKGPITATVFNVYQINTNSNICSLDKDVVGSENTSADGGLPEADGEVQPDEDGNSDKSSDNVNDDASSESDDSSDAKENSEEEKSKPSGQENESEESGNKTEGENDIIISRDKYYTQGVSDADVSKAIEENVGSEVKDSYRRLLIVGLLASMAASILLVLFISGIIKKSKKRRKDRQSDDGYYW